MSSETERLMREVTSLLGPRFEASAKVLCSGTPPILPFELDQLRWAILESLRAPDIVSRMDARVPAALDRIEKADAPVSLHDAKLMAAEVRRLRTERDRVYWAAQVTARKIAEGEGRGQTTDEIWDEVHRG